MSNNAGDAALIPHIDDWADWVSASAMRNYVLNDPLLDWLDLYGEASGFECDEIDERTDFASFIMGKGQQFENAVVAHLAGLAVGEMRTILGEDASSAQRRTDDAVAATVTAMRERVPFVAQGSVRHAESRTYGFPDLLVRSDVLADVWGGSLSSAEATAPASALGLADCHYVVVDIKFTTLHLNKAGNLGNSGSSGAYKVQLVVYNRALGVLQGYQPPRSYLLGRGWDQTVKGAKSRVANCMDRLAPVPHSETFADMTLIELADATAAWVRRVRTEGRRWAVLPEPTVSELLPNAAGENHGRWKSAVKRIVTESEDLTRLWNVGVKKRNAANAAGLTRWSDTDVTPAAVGVKGPTTKPTLQALLDVNRGIGADVQPDRIASARAEWHQPGPVEFYVDFETVSDLDDDFSAIPDNGGQPLIFMVGCGHIEHDEWSFECFTADSLTEPAETVAIDAWIDHMAAVQDRLAPGSTPQMFHWSAHEVSSLQTAYNAAVARHPALGSNWDGLGWFDFLSRVLRAEPVVVRGAFTFGLKEVANALHALGHVDVAWTSGPTDGLGAMVGAWWCQHEVDAGRAEDLAELKLMQEIRAYNEIDCKAMMEIVSYLRQNH